MFIDDTIAAIATAPGEGGIGIIRISGADSIAIASSIFKPFYKENLLDYPNRSLVYGNIVDSDRPFSGRGCNRYYKRQD